MDCKFSLNPTSKGKHKPVVILVKSQLFEGRFMYSTGIKVDVENFKNGVIVSKKEPTKYQKQMEFKTAFENTMLGIEGEITASDLKARVRLALDKVKGIIIEDVEEPKLSPNTSVSEYGLRLIGKGATYYNRKANDWLALTPNTIKAKKQSISKLQAYEKANHITITFENCTVSFWKNFAQYLINKKLAKNTRGKTIKDIKSILNSAVRIDDIVVNEAYKKHGVAPVTSEQIKKVFLTIDQAMELAALPLIDRPGLVKSRDWILIASATGLRYSDFIRLNESNLIDKSRIRIAPQKTKGEALEIPLDIFDWMLPLMERNNMKFPETITSQKLNENLKVLGDMIHVNALSSHSGRHSFISNLLTLGVDAVLIAKLTGHADLKQIQNYEGLTETAAANAVSNLVNDRKSTLMKVG